MRQADNVAAASRQTDDEQRLSFNPQSANCMQSVLLCVDCQMVACDVRGDALQVDPSPSALPHGLVQLQAPEVRATSKNVSDCFSGCIHAKGMSASSQKLSFTCMRSTSLYRVGVGIRQSFGMSKRMHRQLHLAALSPVHLHKSPIHASSACVEGLFRLRVGINEHHKMQGIARGA